MRAVHVVLPNDIDDPRTPSGGNAYDRRICDGLVAAGWTVRERAVSGAWPYPSEADLAGLAGALATVPDRAVVLLDGLVASAAPDELAGEAGRLRLVVLVHMPLGQAAIASPSLAAGAAAARERAALLAADAVIATSEWGRRQLLELYPLSAERVHVAAPGVDAAPPTVGSPGGGRLCCVAAVAPHKGHDVLADALAMISDLDWTCVCVGSLDRDPDFVERLRRGSLTAGLDGRLRLVGPRTSADLDATYAQADLLVLPSRVETYGMVVTEALARGIPVLATAVGGVSEALGRSPDGAPPGTLVPPDDPVALAAALRRWLGDADLRRRLRRTARDRRATLTGWALTSALVAGVLTRVTASVPAPVPAATGGPV